MCEKHADTVPQDTRGLKTHRVWDPWVPGNHLHGYRVVARADTESPDAKFNDATRYVVICSTH